jgi:tRNA A37 N6-isopentenylltransferase MiaA
MTWTNTIPTPTNYYHAPRKHIHRNTINYDDQTTVLQLWMPRNRHEYGDPYQPGQRGHLTMITLHHNSNGQTINYELHYTGKTISATITDNDGQRPMSISEIESLASITRQELQDYNKPKTLLGIAIEAITHYRQKTQQRITNDLDQLLNTYYQQEAGKTITIQ